MKIRFLFILAACLGFLSPTTRAQEGVVHHNRGSETNAIVIAETFINDGYFEVQNFFTATNLTSGSGSIFDVTLTPYEMFGTTRFENNGTIRGLSMRMETVGEFGDRTPAITFTNSGSGIMDFADGFHFGDITETLFPSKNQWFAPVSSIVVDAKTILQQGFMRVGAGGALTLGTTNETDGTFNADLVDAKDGTLVVDPIGNQYGAPLSTSFFDQLLLGGGVGATGTNYINDLGIYDFFWGQGVNTNQDNSVLMVQSGPRTIVNTPDFTVVDQYGARLRTFLTLTDAQSFGYLNRVRGTNWYFNIVFVQTADTNVTTDVRFFPGEYYNNASVINFNTFYSPVIQLSAVLTNALTLQTETSSVYVMDQLGASTNNAIIGNDRFVFFARPNNYFVTRGLPFEFEFGDPVNQSVFPQLFTGPIGFGALGIGNFTNGLIVTNFYAAYDFTMDNFPYHPPTVPGVSVHDLPGRIEINGKSVDLTRTGIRGEGLASVVTDQLMSTTNAVIDSLNLAFDLGFTAPIATPTMPLKIQNLAKDRVARLEGEFLIWSGAFTNVLTITNAISTNTLNFLYHVTVVDATTLNSIQPVSVADFRARTENLQIFDNMIVSNRFETTAKNVTLSSSVELRDVVWTSTNLPNVTNLVIESTGTLRVPGLADFGVTGAPLVNFVNRGAIESYSQSIVADNVDISGSIKSGQEIFFLTVGRSGSFVFTNFFQTDSGPLFMTANKSARLNGASLSTLGNIHLDGPVYKMDHVSLDVGATINLNATSVIQDSGPGAGNNFASTVSLALNNPVIGSLLGTTVDAVPGPRDVYRLVWSVPTNAATASLTQMPTAATWAALTNTAFNVYSTNVAIGTLKLHSGTNTVFEFRGTGKGKAVFIDLLEIDGPGITNLTSLTNQIRLISDTTSSIDVYFADAVSTNIESNLNLGLSNATEFRNLAELLNGKKLGGGTLHWVPNYNGANSSVDAVFGTTSVKMNRSLRQSRIIDLDGDGIANAFDDLPLENKSGPVKVMAVTIGQTDGKVNAQFNAYLGTYALQYSDSLTTPSWKTAATYVHTSSTAALKTIVDPTPVSGTTQRYYRLVYTE